MTIDNYTTRKLQLDLSEDENGELVDPAAIEWEKQLSEGHTIPQGRILPPNEPRSETSIELVGGSILEILQT